MLAVWGSVDWITGGKPAEGVAQVDGILSIVRGYKMEVGAFSERLEVGFGAGTHFDRVS